MKYRHYAPRTPLLLVEGDSEIKIARRLLQEEARLRQKREKAGFLISYETAAALPTVQTDRRVEILGSRQHTARIAEHLYDALRRLDEAGVDLILAEGYREEEMGTAVMNRLRKAASRVERV